jgi:hypothetical protein
MSTRVRAADATPPGRGDCWIPKIAHAPSPKNLTKNGLAQKGGSFSVEGVFAKKNSGAGEDSAVVACVRLQSRACGRGPGSVDDVYGARCHEGCQSSPMGFI